MSQQRVSSPLPVFDDKPSFAGAGAPPGPRRHAQPQPQAQPPKFSHPAYLHKQLTSRQRAARAPPPTEELKERRRETGAGAGAGAGAGEWAASTRRASGAAVGVEIEGGGESCVDVRNGGLVSVPTARLLASVERLRILILDNNRIDALPPTLSALAGLRKLSARNNLIARVHRLDGDRLAHLQSVDLSRNRLRRLEWAHGFHSLRALQTLELADNPLASAEPGVLAALLARGLRRFSFDWTRYLPAPPSAHAHAQQQQQQEPTAALARFARDFASQNQPCDFLDFLRHALLPATTAAAASGGGPLPRAASPPLLAAPVVASASPSPARPAKLRLHTKAAKGGAPALGSLRPFPGGRGLLHRAVELGHAALLDFLLASEAPDARFDPALKDASGVSPLALAVKEARHDLLRVFRSRGARFEARRPLPLPRAKTAALPSAPARPGFSTVGRPAPQAGDSARGGPTPASSSQAHAKAKDNNPEPFFQGESVLFDAVAAEAFATASFLIRETGLSPRVLDASGNSLLHLTLARFPSCGGEAGAEGGGTGAGTGTGPDALNRSLIEQEGRPLPASLVGGAPQPQGAQRAGEARALLGLLCERVGFEGVNLRNKHGLSALHLALKKGRAPALAFALAHNAALQARQAARDDERLLLALRRCERPLAALPPLLARLELERARRAPPAAFDLNAACGRKKQTGVHLLADLENCALLGQLVNGAGGAGLEALDLRALEADLRRPLEFPIIKSPCYKLLQFAENEQSRRVRYARHRLLARLLPLFGAPAPPLLARRPALPLPLAARPAPAQEAAVRRLHEFHKQVERESAFRLEWTLRLRERLLALGCRPPTASRRLPLTRHDLLLFLAATPVFRPHWPLSARDLAPSHQPAARVLSRAPTASSVSTTSVTQALLSNTHTRTQPPSRAHSSALSSRGRTRPSVTTTATAHLHSRGGPPYPRVFTPEPAVRPHATAAVPVLLRGPSLSSQPFARPAFSAHAHGHGEPPRTRLASRGPPSPPCEARDSPECLVASEAKSRERRHHIHDLEPRELFGGAFRLSNLPSHRQQQQQQ